MTVTRQGETVFENNDGDIVPGDDLFSDGIDPADVTDALKEPAHIPEGDDIYLTTNDRNQLALFAKNYDETFESLSDNYASADQKHAEVRRKLGANPEEKKAQLINLRKEEAAIRLGAVAAKHS